MKTLGHREVIADGEGFEPPVPCGTAVFKTAAIVHSATHPKLILALFLLGFRRFPRGV